MGERGFEAILEELTNQHDAQPMPRIPPGDIIRLPTTEVTEAHVKNEVQCITCLETFKLAEKVVILDCEHIFHRQCSELLVLYLSLLVLQCNQVFLPCFSRAVVAPA
jgi:hypothetical protein